MGTLLIWWRSNYKTDTADVILNGKFSLWVREPELPILIMSIQHLLEVLAIEMRKQRWNVKVLGRINNLLFIDDVIVYIKTTEEFYINITVLKLKVLQVCSILNQYTKSLVFFIHQL